MTDGPIYRAISNPNAVLVFEDLDRAMQWFQTDAFEEASARSTAIRRDFYLADSQHPT
jgi:uncharacterized protein (DUF1330 family)